LAGLIRFLHKKTWRTFRHEAQSQEGYHPDKIYYRLRKSLTSE